MQKKWKKRHIKFLFNLFLFSLISHSRPEKAIGCNMVFSNQNLPAWLWS